MRVMAGPVIGEFGWIVFDVAPHVRTFLLDNHEHHRVVVCQREHRLLFEAADEFLDIPPERMPPHPSVGRSYSSRRPREPLDSLVGWATSKVAPDETLRIPYFHDDFKPYVGWHIQPTHRQLSTGWRPQLNGYFVVACRNRNSYGKKKNWPFTQWIDLVGRLAQTTGLRAVSIGHEESYFPPGTEPAKGIIKSVGALNGAKFSVSSNSGPTHLSLMSGCPTFSWGQASGHLKRRMEDITNPFKVPVRYAGLGWGPTVDQVWEALEPWVTQLLK